MSRQIEMVSLEELISLNHNYRKFKSYIPVSLVLSHLKELDNTLGNKGYGIERMFYCLLL